MKKILIITNPYSGKKQASKILSDILDVFNKTPIETITTEYKNHPYKIANTIDFGELTGIVVIGGDGECGGGGRSSGISSRSRSNATNKHGSGAGRTHEPFTGYRACSSCSRGRIDSGQRS